MDKYFLMNTVNQFVSLLPRENKNKKKSRYVVLAFIFINFFFFNQSIKFHLCINEYNFL